MQLDPYLFFDGRCEEAMQYYRSIFGGELDLSRYAGSPLEAEVGPAYAQKIIHSTLSTDDFNIMAADRPGSAASATRQNISLSFATNDETQGRNVFDRLSEGGAVQHPLEKAFWGGTFGMCSDRFGIDWMISIHTA